MNFSEHYLTVNFKSSARGLADINSKQLWLVRMDWHIILSEGFEVHSSLRKHIERIMDHDSR